MRFDIITIFPQLFESFLREALISRAQKKKIIEAGVHNLRAWTSDRHKTVDDRPYGGGPGMVMMVAPIARAVSDLKRKKGSRVIIFSPKGKKFSQTMAKRFSEQKQLIMICGRYEGIDERVAKYLADEEVSIGDYVLFGGEVPAMVVIEAVTRLLPGAIGKSESLADESFGHVKGVAKKQLTGFLEYPHYTRPEAINIAGKSRRVPKVLKSGDHKKIEAWRRTQSEKLTRKRRPDLLKKIQNSKS